MLTVHSAFGQTIPDLRGFLKGDSNIVIGKDGSVKLKGRIDPGSMHFQWNHIPGIQDSMPTSRGDASKHYYLGVVPPAQKAKQVDHSNVWLLNNEVAQTWH